MIKTHSRGTWQRLVITSLLSSFAITLLGLVNPPPARAGIFDFLIGRRSSRGNATGTEQGGGVRSGRLAGGVNPSLPYVTTPRNTYLVSSSFLIEWNPVPGATGYTVQLWRWADAYGERQWKVWENTTPETAIIYDGSIPLSPARYYSIEVVAQTAVGLVSSNQDIGCDATGFSLLFPENIDLLTSDLAQIDTRQISSVETALAFADIYFRYGLLDLAVESLKTPADWETSVPINLALGELYSHAGLNELSLQRYQTALQLNGTPLEQAIAQEGVGDVNAVLLNLDEARTRLLAASRLYRVADEETTAAAVDRRVESLERFQRSAQATPEAKRVQQAAIALCQTAPSL